MSIILLTMGLNNSTQQQLSYETATYFKIIFKHRNDHLSQTYISQPEC